MDRSMAYKFLLAAVVAVSVSFTSCGEYTKLTKSTDTDLKYDKAMEYFEGEDYIKSATLLESVIPGMRGTAKGEEGLYTLAMSYYKNRDYIMARGYFSSYCKAYPSGKHAEDARYHIGACYYHGSPDVKLDQTNTQKAIDELLAFSQAYPHSRRIPKAVMMLTEMQDKLAQKEYINAKLYYDLGDYMGNNYLSAVVTASNALKNYPDCKYREELSFLILESKYMQAVKSVEAKMEDRYRDTLDEYYTFVKEYPESSHRKEADRFFKRAQRYLEKN